MPNICATNDKISHTSSPNPCGGSRKDFAKEMVWNQYHQTIYGLIHRILSKLSNSCKISPKCPKYVQKIVNLHVLLTHLTTEDSVMILYILRLTHTKN